MSDNNQPQSSNRNPQSSNRNPRKNDGWLNQTINVGDRNVSLGTIVLGTLGVMVIFGTSWASGIFSPIGISTIITVVALFLAYENRGVGFWTAVVMFVTFFALFRASLWFLRDYLPETIMSNDMSQWAAVTDEYKANMPLAADPFGGDSIVSDIFVNKDQPSYSFDGGSGQLSVMATPDANYGGGVPNTAVPDNSNSAVTDTSAAPIPTAPSPTPDPVVALLYDLNTAAQYNDKAAATTAAQAILRMEPNNSEAKNVLAQIAAAEATLINKRIMPVTPTVWAKSGEAGRVERALAGGSYRIMDDADTLTNVACQEIATIEEIGGWLNGEQYRVKRCLLDQFNVGKTGDEFTVPGR